VSKTALADLKTRTNKSIGRARASSINHDNQCPHHSVLIRHHSCRLKDSVDSTIHFWIARDLPYNLDWIDHLTSDVLPTAREDDIFLWFYQAAVAATPYGDKRPPRPYKTGEEAAFTIMAYNGDDLPATAEVVYSNSGFLTTTKKDGRRAGFVILRNLRLKAV
jgi:hypothetical protein